jgi:hypothetical protein
MNQVQEFHNAMKLIDGSREDIMEMARNAKFLLPDISEQLYEIAKNLKTGHVEAMQAFGQQVDAGYRSAQIGAGTSLALALEAAANPARAIPAIPLENPEEKTPKDYKDTKV